MKDPFEGHDVRKVDRFRDKEHFHQLENWPSGPWDDEPDKVEWRDAATGYPCLISRGPMGNWCGYVGIPPGHPQHGKAYEAAPDLRVHGGITYANSCDEEGTICHVPGPGEPADVWWYGFDCGHAFDQMPFMIAMRRQAGEPAGGWIDGQTYRDMPFVKEEVELLARQLKKLEDGNGSANKHGMHRRR